MIDRPRLDDFAIDGMDVVTFRFGVPLTSITSRGGGTYIACADGVVVVVVPSRVIGGVYERFNIDGFVCVGTRVRCDIGTLVGSGRCIHNGGDKAATDIVPPLRLSVDRLVTFIAVFDFGGDRRCRLS